MADKGVEKRHSETALVAAIYRAIAYRDFNKEALAPDYLADHFLPPHIRFFLKFKKVRANGRKKTDKFTPGMYEYMVARTAFFDGLFKDALEKSIPQIVLLGGGYDTRAFRFAKANQATTIFELDIETTQKRKKKCLAKAQIDVPKQVKLLPIDFNRESLIDVLGKAGFETDKKTLFIWEGVIYYLEPPSIDATLEFVKTHSPANSTIAFDYSLTITEQNMKGHFGAETFIETWKKYRKNESFKFTLEDGQLDSFLKERGLQPEAHYDHQQIADTFLPTEKTEFVGQISGMFSFAVASNN
jgi:methyltransferase (TIGR00027 family)